MNNLETLRNNPDVIANPHLFALVCEVGIDLQTLAQQKKELLAAFTTAFEQGTFPENVVADVRMGKYL